MAPRTGETLVDQRRASVSEFYTPEAPVEGFFSKIRQINRFVLISLWTSAMFMVWVLVWIGIFYNQSWRIRWRNAVFGVWAKRFLRIIGARVTVQGSPPESPFFMVSNHLSYLDIPVLASIINATFVAKREVKDWTVIGMLTTAMETIFIDRDDCFDIPRVNDEIKHRLGFGDAIILFPEATSTDGERVHPFNSPLLEVPVETSRPVEYAHLQYSTPTGVVAAKDVLCFWGDMQFGSHFIKLLALPEFSVTVTFGSGSLTGNCRKLLARRLTSAVRNLHMTHPQNRWIPSQEYDRSGRKPEQRVTPATEKP